jgi:glycosyltransferase involved in cell wall biosynthesis
MPRVSVVMPCFNHARFVGESVAAILGQTSNDLELIVVDDKSKDDSVDVLRELATKDARLKLIVHDQNRGASRSRNDGLRMAHGEFAAFCDADDLWKPHKLERQIKLLTSHPDCDVTYCDSEIIDETGQATGELFSGQYPLPREPSGDLFMALCETNFINMQTLLLRRKPIGERIFFDENIKWVEDWWLCIRLSRHHRFCYEPDTLARYRVHSQSTNLTQQLGISRNRWKVGKRNLKTHRDMPLRLQAVIWYQMGMDLCALEKRRPGCQFLRQALYCGLRGGLSPTRLAKMSARLGLEWSRRKVEHIGNPVWRIA